GELMRARRLMGGALLVLGVVLFRLSQWSIGIVALLLAGPKSQPGTIDGMSTVAVTVTSSPPRASPQAVPSASQLLTAAVQAPWAPSSSDALRAPARAAVPACWAV